VLESEVECNDPPRCYSVGGVCDPATGYCNYEPHSKGVGCSDDYACTVGDECDGTGGCIPGQLCPPSGPCVASNCVDGECVEDDLADGVLCGPQEASRCCSGSCRDVSSDEANCGGCGMACVVGESCESVSVTATCSSAPSQTSGRCTCSGSNADCPGGQVCRTDAPFPDYCAPESPSDCSDGASLVELSGCPNYCAY
jgi:hypothetical protein